VLLIKRSTISVYFFFLLQPWGVAWPGSVTHTHRQWGALRTSIRNVLNWLMVFFTSFFFCRPGAWPRQGVSHTDRGGALRVSIRGVDRIRSTSQLAHGALLNLIRFFFLHSPASVYFFFLLQPWGLALPGGVTQTVGCAEGFHQAR
jgi:hypothetical protein